jgi:osmotically-inducible protein OsmY
MPPPQTSRGPTGAEHAKHGAIGHLSADEELQQAVLRALIEDAELDSSDIGVRVAQETVTLSGSVPTREDWRRASSVAESQRGVAHVHAGELHVRRT